ncbi:MAG: hypothetical protein PHX87_01740 [Candidatus Peribacteraceae bacterium]|nr:hypothetical protein [Candidatus Peribacteraceae bacterium]MDD5742130.1 hypothetical protein [Candidatus Peribacteraceae bacterium]
MSQSGDDENGIPDLSNKQLLKVLLDEIAAVRGELRADISALDRKFTFRFDGLSAEFKTLKSDFQALRIEVHQNQLTLMNNREELEQRVEVLEAAA